MASFWFEERGTEKYWRHGLKAERRYYDPEKTVMFDKPVLRDEDGRAYWEIIEVDWEATIDCTREEYEAEQASGEAVRNRIWQKRENTELQRVDELICEFMGEPAPDLKSDSQFYFWCHETAFWVLYMMGGSFIGDKADKVEGDHLTELHKRMDETIARIIEEDPREEAQKFRQEGYQARCHALIDWVFTKKWEYHAAG